MSADSRALLGEAMREETREKAVLNSARNCVALCKRCGFAQWRHYLPVGAKDGVGCMGYRKPKAKR